MTDVTNDPDAPDTEYDEQAPAPTKPPNVLVRLYRGETTFPFCGRRRWWYGISALVILAGLVSLGVRGLNLGIDFKGGTSWEVPANGVSISKATDVVKAAGVVPSLVQVVGVGANAHLHVEADLKNESTSVRTDTEMRVADALATATNTSTKQAEQNVSDVGPTWGKDITNKAILAVIVFFIVVVAYISFRFEWKMAIAAVVAVIHDLLVVAGVYSLSGLQVTPDTVVAVLTILGYSLYDTVVVFDRVRENARGFGASGRMTYEDLVDLSMNQTLARSINTSLVAILPVLSVLVIGAQVLGATTLQYFGFALVIGLLSGAYSSIFIASPLLAQMKEREPRYATVRQRLATRAERELLTPRAAALASATAGGGGRSQARAGRTPPRRQGEVLRPGARRPTGRPTAGGSAMDEGAAADGDVAATRPAGGGGARPGGGSGARRPPPRPRKGGGKGRKGGRRR
ncbi:MAG TPA: protein translocase subunit SecF [Acidimicrobiales bacterium]|nr:protein translocase subunit SecF [Acidimicrobiales bacterium]